MLFMRRGVNMFALGVLLALSAGCHPAENASATKPAVSPASAVESRLNDPGVSQEEKDQIRKHMTPGAGQ